MPNEDFQQHLHPILQELELVRRDQLNRMAFILIALLVAVAVGMLLLIPTFIIVILFLSLPVYLLMFGTRRKRLDVRSEFRPRVMRVIADSLPEWDYDQHRFMPRAVYDAASLNLPVPDVYEGQDLFYATVHGAPSSLSELLTRQQERSPDGSIQYTTLFNGLLLSVQLPKAFSGIHYLAGTGDEQKVQDYLKRFGDINTFLPEPVQDDTCRIGEQVWLSTIPQEAVSLMRGPLGPVLRELSDKAASPLLLSCKGQHFCLAVPLPEKIMEPSVFRSLLTTRHIVQYKELLETLLGIPALLTTPANNS